MKKIMLLFVVLFAIFAISGCSSNDVQSGINVASDEEESSDGYIVSESSDSDEVEDTLDDELLSDDDDVEIGELI